jgi:hypothetical protein
MTSLRLIAEVLGLGHVARFLDKRSEITVREDNDKAYLFKITDVTASQNDLNWHHHNEADVSALRLQFSAEQAKTHGSLIFLTVFNIWQRCEITEFLKVDGLSALCLFGPVNPSVSCGVAVRLYEGSENQRVIGQCLELV